MLYSLHVKFGGKSGQAMFEYVLVFLAMVVVVLALGWLVTALRHSANRTRVLVSAQDA